MSVSLTSIKLAAAMRIGNGVDALVEPQSSIISRVLAVSKATVERYAKNAPEAVQNEATVRMAGFLFDSQPGNSRRFAHAFEDSGAKALLAPWRVVRATKIEEDE